MSHFDCEMKADVLILYIVKYMYIIIKKACREVVTVNFEDYQCHMLASTLIKYVSIPTLMLVYLQR